MDILFFSNIPSPYFVAYVNELGKLADVTAVYEDLSYKDRDASWKSFKSPNARSIILKGLSLGEGRKISFYPFKLIWKFRKSRIIIANPTTLCGILCIFFCKLLRIPFIIQSEGGLPKDGKGLKEHFKKFLMQGAALYLSGMTPERDYFLTYGAPIEKIKQYPFASLYKRDFPKELLSLQEKECLRKELGITEKNVILFVGQFIYRKGIDILLESLSQIHSEVGVYLVGGESKQEYQDIIDKYNLKNIHFVNFIQLDVLKKYYMAADFFVLPTREDTWGLVVNEAMSYGLPVITTNRCVAGIELIENDVNGYVISTDDSFALSKKIEYLLENPNLRDQMALNNFEKIKDYNYENMARAIYSHLQSLDA